MTCDCGWSFVEQAMTAPRRLPGHAGDEDQSEDSGGGSSGNSQVLLGVLFLLGGIIITAVTYDSASSGGSYIIAYGPMIYGVYSIIRGVARMSR
jgi:hypothetical protein